jgi:hypothetical protein
MKSKNQYRINKERVIIRIMVFSLFFWFTNLSANAGIVNFSTFKEKSYTNYKVIKDSSKAEYKINNKVVSKDKFEKFNNTLKEINGTWYCAETMTGGITGYDAKDKKSDIYEVRSCYDSGKSSNSITLKTNDE